MSATRHKAWHKDPRYTEVWTSQDNGESWTLDHMEGPQERPTPLRAVDVPRLHAVPTPIRAATDEDRRVASLDRPIPFYTVDPAALVQAEDLYAEMTGEADALAFSAAVNLYLEAASS